MFYIEFSSFLWFLSPSILIGLVTELNSTPDYPLPSTPFLEYPDPSFPYES